MSTASGIKSGMAYVQAYLDDNPLTQGLTKLRAKLISWQSKLGSMGSKAYGGQLPEPFAAVARFATSPAGVFTGLLGAAKHTAEVREQMLRMSETAGVSVEHFSAAAYAANKYGVSMEALAAGLKRMETKEFAAMLGGGKGGGKGGGGMKGFAKGLFGGLGGGDAMDRMIALARKMEGQSAKIQAGMARAAGMGDLLPMLRQGGDALEADIRHAKELGLVLSGPDAEAAEKFGFAWKDLQAVIGNAVGQIGGALLPLLTGLTRMVSRVALATRDWVKQHKTLVIGLFAAAAAIVAGGIALKLMAVGVSLATTAVAVMKGVVLLASGALDAAHGDRHHLYGNHGLGRDALYSAGRGDRRHPRLHRLRGRGLRQPGQAVDGFLRGTPARRSPRSPTPSPRATSRPPGTWSRPI